MVTLSVAAQAPSPRPKLVVGIVIDGLREDYLDLLKGYFGENGFKLLMRDGVMLDNVNYGTALDASATAPRRHLSTMPRCADSTPLYSTPRR